MNASEVGPTRRSWFVVPRRREREALPAWIARAVVWNAVSCCILGLALWLCCVGGCSPVAELGVKIVYVVPLGGLALQVFGTVLEHFWPGCSKYL